MRLSHVRVERGAIVVHAGGSACGVCATAVGRVGSAAVEPGGRPVEGVEIGPADGTLQALGEALDAFLGGAPLHWDGPLDERGITAFQRDVYRAVRGIPHGERWTCADVAAGLPGDVSGRAVGVALVRNPWPIVVPCHRVVAAGGLGGFVGGGAVKRLLLALEAGQRDLPWEGSR